jgi:hypothetical protein
MGLLYFTFIRYLQKFSSHWPWKPGMVFMGETIHPKTLPERICPYEME